MPPRHAGRWVAPALPLIALLLAAAPLGAQRALAHDDDLETPEVTSLRINGTKALHESDLRQSIATTASHCRSLLLKPLCLVSKSRYFYQREYLDRTELRRDVLRVRIFYWKRGYRQTTVDTLVTESDHGRKVSVTFKVHEGPPTLISVVRAGPDEAPLTRRDRGRLVSVRAGQPLNLLAIDSSRARLRDALWDRGYSDADVTVAVDAADTATTGAVTFTLVPKKLTTVGEIRISGNEEVSDRTIRNSLTFGPGDLFKRTDVVRSQRSMYESGLFKRAAIDTIETDSTVADSVKVIVVKVQEAPPREARLSAGFNTVEFVQTEARFTHYNWLGGARRLDLQGTVGNLLAAQLNGRGIFRDVLTNAGDERARFLAPTWQASADMRQRWFGSPLNTVGLNVFAHRRSAPGIFVDRGYGTSATFTREFGERAPVSANYRFEITRVEAGDLYFCVNYGVCDAGTIGALRENQRLSPLTLTGSWDRTNNPLGPSRGFIARVTLEHASAFTVSDYRYNRGFAEGAYFFRLGEGSVIATRLRVGVVRALQSTEDVLGATALHPRKRFYAGGSQSVRGFGENQLGPRVLTIAPEKLRGKNGEYCPLSTPIEDCDPNAAGTTTEGEALKPVEDVAFTPRPVGGSGLLEGSVEYRFPSPFFPEKLIGAVFVDGGVVGGGSELADFVKGNGAFTPGVGVRYRSPIGHIRVDLGYRPRSTEPLSVITEDDTPGVGRRLVPLRTMRNFTEGAGFLDRLTLHLSIGEAF